MESFEGFSSDFSLGAWNDFGHYEENPFLANTEGFNDEHVNAGKDWGTYLDESAYQLAEQGTDKQVACSFISTTSEENYPYGLDLGGGTSDILNQLPLEDATETQEQEWQLCTGDTVQLEDQAQQRVSNKEYLSETAPLYSEKISDQSDSLQQYADSLNLNENFQSNYAQDSYFANELEDLEGSTSAAGRKMTPEERSLMLFKRKLRNRESAARTRTKRAKTMKQIGEELEELRQKADLLETQGTVLLNTEEENKKLQRENAHLRNVIKQYATELATVRYKLKVYESSSYSAHDVTGMKQLQPQFEKEYLEMVDGPLLKKNDMNSLQNSRNGEMASLVSPCAETSTLDVLERMANQPWDDMKYMLPSRDRRQAIARTNTFLRERSLN
eukprot:jgi/Galph1/1282/GphlegSOOS_G6057.1